MTQKIIIAPLNWGLGHASRSVPLIKSFLSNSWEVILASDGAAYELLKKEFPQLKIYELPSYGITYPHASIVFNLLSNARKFNSAIGAEKKVIQKIMDKEKADLILSDNRYGIFDKRAKSIFLGHQINLRTGNYFFSKAGSLWNKYLIRKFDELRVPDYEGEDALAGRLSSADHIKNKKYIGPLSRLECLDTDFKYDLCAVISGPEPQRSRFQKIIEDQLLQLNERSVLILGRMDEAKDYMLNENVRVISHLTTTKLNNLINSSNVVISRSGYSTVMDLTKLGKKAILVPTPGQGEQIYLARHLRNRFPQFIFEDQRKINIPAALEALNKIKPVQLKPSKFDVSKFL